MPIYTFAYNPRSLEFQKNCVLEPIPGSAMAAVVFTALDVFQGTPAQYAFQPRNVAQYFGALWLYHGLQCPMEAVQGRPSLLHNIVSAGTIGYLGVRSGRLGVPFINPYMYNNVRPEVAAFGVYGGMAGLLAGVLGGKRF